MNHQLTIFDMICHHPFLPPVKTTKQVELKTPIPILLNFIYSQSSRLTELYSNTEKPPVLNTIKPSTFHC